MDRGKLGASPPGPPFATATLARLYLAQGHRTTARALVEALKAQGDAALGDLEAALDDDRSRRVAVLEGLLAARGAAETRMGFRETLEQLCSGVDGALAASIMGYDGIAVDTHEVDPASLGRPVEVSVSSTMIEYSSIFGQIRQAAAQLQAGEASEFSIRTEKIVAVGRAVSPEYFVVLALTPEGNVGKARYALRIGAGKIAAEL